MNRRQSSASHDLRYAINRRLEEFAAVQRSLDELIAFAYHDLATLKRAERVLRRHLDKRRIGSTRPPSGMEVVWHSVPGAKPLRKHLTSLSVARRLLTHLKTHGPASCREVSVALEIPSAMVRSAISALFETGRVDRDIRPRSMKT